MPHLRLLNLCPVLYLFLAFAPRSAAGAAATTTTAAAAAAAAATVTAETVVIDGVPHTFTVDRRDSFALFDALGEFCSAHALGDGDCSALAERIATRWLPRPRIASPPDLAVVGVSPPPPSGSNKNNNIPIVIVLDREAEARGHATTTADTTSKVRIALRMRINGGDYTTSASTTLLCDFTNVTFYLGPLWTPLGAIGLTTIDAQIGLVVSDTQTLWSEFLTATSTFDVLPLRLSRSSAPLTPLAARSDATSKALLPRRRIRISHVTVLGSIPNGQTTVLVQAALALDQRYFEVMFITTREPDWNNGDVKELSRHCIGVVHVQMKIQKSLLAKYGGHPSDVMRALGQQYEATGTVKDTDLYDVIRPLVAALRGSDIVTFTNIASSQEKDKSITVAAALAGVAHRLCDPGNLNHAAPMLLGATGLLVPSFVAKQHWMQVLRDNRKDMPIHVVQPGAADRSGSSCTRAKQHWMQVLHDNRKDMPIHVVQPGAADRSGSSCTRANSDGHNITIAFLGRLDQVKSPSVFLRVAYQIVSTLGRPRDRGTASSSSSGNDDDDTARLQVSSSVRFLVIGTGPLEQRLHDLAKRLGLRGRIVFTGALNHADVLCLLSTTVDLVLHTTLTNETFGLSNVEAMRAGVPVISYGVGGQADYLREGVSHGFVVHEPTVDAMASVAIRLLLSGEDTRKQMGAAARQFVLEHGLDLAGMATRFASLYTSLVMRSGPEDDEERNSPTTTSILPPPLSVAPTHARDESAIFFFQRGQDLTDELNFDPAVTSDVAHFSREENSHFLPAIPLFDRRVRLHRGVPFSEWHATRSIALAAPAANAAAKRMLSHRYRTSVQRVIRQGIQEWHESTSVDPATGRKSLQYPKYTGWWPGKAKSRGNFYMASRHKILHDAAQFRFNVRNGLLPNVFLDVADNYTRMHDQYLGRNGMNDYVFMDRRHLELVGTTYNRFNYRYPTRRVGAGNALSNTTDFVAAEERYFHVDNNPGITVIDDFLSAESLTMMLNMLQSSSIWFDVKLGYLGAYHAEGLASPLLLQIGEEIRERLPNVVGSMPLRTIWAYKCMQSSPEGLALHADAAAVNLNLWITPDSANLDPEGGGLIVYLSDELPQGWSFEEMNRMSRVEDMRAFLMLQPSTRAVRVPYRQNRAVIFHSRLFHESGKSRFREGFENMRINLTFLFGFR